MLPRIAALFVEVALGPRGVEEGSLGAVRQRAVAIDRHLNGERRCSGLDGRRDDHRQAGAIVCPRAGSAPPRVLERCAVHEHLPVDGAI